MYDEIIDVLIDFIQRLTTFPVYLGSNPTKESIGVEGYGNPEDIFMDKDTAQVLNVTINGKSANQELLLRELTKVHRKLFLRKDYPQGDNWHIYSIETTASPRLIAIEEAERNKWLYGSSVKVKFYQKGMKGELNNA